METTLALLRKDNRILLGEKKRGFGKGKLNGVGGKIEQGESIEEAMIRETYEEIGVKPTRFEKVGELTFDEMYKGEKLNLTFYLYNVYDWEGEIVETEEMKPLWVDISSIPYDNMFPDDRYWLPLILEDKKIKAYFNFDEDWNIIEKKIEEVEYE